MKRFLEKTSIIACSKFPRFSLSMLRKLSKTLILLPYYHIVSDEEVPHVKHCYTFRKTKKFRDDIDFFLRHYLPVSLHTLLNYLQKNQPLPEKIAFHLTFDDGFAEQYHVIAPILKEKGVPATFFLVSDFLDNKQLFYKHKASILIETFQKMNKISSIKKIMDIFCKYGIKFTNFAPSLLSVTYYQQEILNEIASVLDIDFVEYLTNSAPYLTSNQVEDLIKDGFTIGAHSVNHPKYSLLSIEEQLSQTKESMNIIHERFSLNYKAFAFPHTDIGVSRKYFEEIFSNGYIDISFGTAGMINDAFLKHFQRFKMEKPLEPAERIVARECIGKLSRIVRHCDEIQREPLQ